MLKLLISESWGGDARYKGVTSPFYNNGHDPHFAHNSAVDSANTLPCLLRLFCPPPQPGLWSGQWSSHIHTPCPPIMVAQPTIFFLDFLFVIGVPLFKGGSALPHILPPAFFTGGQVNHITAVTIKLFPDMVGSLCICAGEFSPLHQNWTGNPASATFGTSRVLYFFAGFHYVGYPAF